MEWLKYAITIYVVMFIFWGALLLFARHSSPKEHKDDFPLWFVPIAALISTILVGFVGFGADWY